MDPSMNSQSAGVHNLQESSFSLPASQILSQMNQLYVMLQERSPEWCQQNSFRSLVEGRSDAQLRELHVHWVQWIEYGRAQVPAAVSMG